MDKQIEEIPDFMLFSKRKELAEEYEEWVNKPLEDGSKIKDCALSVITFMQIKGFRKIPENAVVLTREEYERLLKEETLCERLGNDIDVKLKYIYELEDKVAQERKETAEKFAEMVSKAFMSVNCIDIDEWNWCQRKIDEICEEIIGEKNDK